ncbi:MAG: hypothetical protein BWY82_02022 [Verrucomicrobia bacterium ADurb.Bin474]|nr:MAG: hypothetical protein BWY82_02022 [Verrucomicrobia bacterium ADurb.Bin474]
MSHRERIFPIHMEHGRFDHLGDVRAILAGPCIRRVCCEPDLIIDHDMEGSPGPVAFEFREIEHLGHRSLSGNRRIPMDQQRQHHTTVERATRLPKDALPGTRPPFNDRIHCLKVARIRCEPYRNRIPALRLPSVFIAQVVFDVTVPIQIHRNVMFRKFAQDQVA